MNQPISERFRRNLNATGTRRPIQDFYKFVRFVSATGGISGLSAWLEYRIANDLYANQPAVGEKAEVLYLDCMAELRAVADLEEAKRTTAMSYQERLERIIERERLRRSWKPSLPVAVRLS